MGKYLKKISLIFVALAMIISTTSISIFAEDIKERATNEVYLVVNSKTNYMGYYKNGDLIKEFRVSTGTRKAPTPNGKHKIVNRIVNRPYYTGGIPGGSPNNPLGNRWMGLHVGSTYGTTYGVHGNNNENSIGKNVTGGCIRMHNNDIRWLFDQVPTGAYVIVDNSDKSYIEIATKYGVKLKDPNAITQNIKNLEAEFNKFSIYNNKIKLLDKNSYITNSNDATKILETKNNYLNPYNKLTSKEKSHPQVKNIHSNYTKIVNIVEGAEAVLKFYENVTAQSKDLINNSKAAASINNVNSQNLGTRGKAQKEFNEAIAYEGISGSNRMIYLNNQYTDTINFLEISQALGSKDINTAKSKASKIKDGNYKLLVNNAISAFSDLDNHWAEDSIKEAMNAGWVDLSKIFRPDASITRAEFVKIINRAFGFTEQGEVNLNDVDKSMWYYNEVSIAISKGYINGYDDNTFRPNDNITREEVAKIISSIMNNVDEDIDKISKYKDFNEVSEWALSYVEGVVEAGYMGNGGIDFRPKENITRAESVVTIQRTR
ncbi:MAG: S-layer homology domain-containing protein [Romboutsia sp.]